MKNQIVKRFPIEEDLVVFRYPCFSDWAGIMKKTNSLTMEKSFGSPQYRQTPKQYRKSMRERLTAIKNKRAVYLVATINEVIIGTASIWIIPGEPKRGSLEISIRNTLPRSCRSLWGKGIGKKLMYAIMHEAKTKLGIKTVKLGVYVANHRAVKLYKRCGFKEMYRVRKEKYHFGVMRDRVYMQKHLH